MAMNKYDFIIELLEEKKLKLNQRELILKLSAKEISTESTLDNRVKKIEEIIFNSNSSKIDNISEDSKVHNGSNLIKDADRLDDEMKYREPIQLYKFLFSYNQDKVLKSTCHDMDSDGIATVNQYCETETYDFQKHLHQIHRAYNKLADTYFTSPKSKALIRGFLTGEDYEGEKLEKGWSEDSIKVNWNSPDLLAWAKNNPGIPPNLNETILEKNKTPKFEFKRINSKVIGKPIQNFTQLVLHFKNLFHIRYDNSLRDLIENKNKSEKWNDKIEFEITNTNFPKNIEFFTDIDKLVQAYKKIINIILNKHKDKSKPQVRLSFIESESNVCLSIHHQNSIYRKTVINTKERTGEAYDDLIENQINGLCNMHLKANFDNGKFAEINLWDGNKRQEKKIETFQGVEHILEFPKK